MIKIHDERLVRLIVIGKKKTQRFPANRHITTGKLTHPKIVAGKVHKVYTQAPFGTGGNPDAQPLLEVMVDKVEPDVLGSLTEEDARSDGYASVEAFVKSWNYIYRDKPIHFHLNQFRPVWVISFTYLKTLPAGEKLLRKLKRQAKKKAKEQKA